jgi:hypothetical protein
MQITFTDNICRTLAYNLMTRFIKRAMQLFYKKHAFSGKLFLILVVDILIYVASIKLFIE